MAPAASIYNYKLFATDAALDSGDFKGGTALQLALEDGASVANCSWGMGEVGADKSRLAVAAETVVALGMAVVKSAGNGGPGLATMTAPAEADGVIVVGATDRDGTAVQDYSSRGPALVNAGPHLVAPGGSFAEPIAGGVVGGAGYLEPGTSFAVPHVTGAVALILERRPDAEPDDVLHILSQAARPLPGTPASAGGAGLLQIPDSV